MALTAVDNGKTNFAPLLARIAANEWSAFEECVGKYGDLIWTVATRFTDSPEAAEDAAIQIFRDIWRSAAGFESSGLKERHFISIIASRRLCERQGAYRRTGGRYDTVSMHFYQANFP